MGGSPFYSIYNSKLIEITLVLALSSICVIMGNKEHDCKKITFLGKLKGIGHRYCNSMFFGISSIWCLFRFTSINGNKKFQHTASEKSRRSAHLCSTLRSPIGTPASWVYPEEYNWCSKFRVSHNSSRVTPYSIKTFNAVSDIKAAAAVKNTKFYDEVRDLDLIP